MSAMLRRELSQHARWAWAAPALFALALSHGGWGPERWLSPISDAFQAVTFFGFAAFAAALGFVQFHGDRRGGARDVLLHRPVSPGALFWGRVIAGLLVLAASTLLPLALVLAWCAHGQQAPEPFRWTLALPALVDVEAALLHYFGGALVALRPARWHGSRLLPAACALACQVAVYPLPDASLAGACLALPVPFFVAAAHGAFLPPPARREAGVPALATAAVLAGGLLLVVGVLMFVGGGLLERPAGTWVAHWVSGDGQVRRREGLGAAARVTVLGGPETGTLPSAAGEETGPRLRLSFQRPELARDAWHRSAERTHRRLYWPTLGTRWYFVHEEGLAVGYDEHSGQPVGLLGTDGFRRPGEPPPSRFPGRLLDRDLSPAGLLATERSVYRVDPEARTVRLVHRAAPQRRLRRAAWARAGGGSVRAAESLHVALVEGDRLVATTAAGQRWLDVPMAAPATGLAWADVLRLGGGRAAVTYAAEGDGELTDLVVWHGPDGREAHRLGFPARRERARPTLAAEVLAGALLPPALRLAWPPTARLLGLAPPRWLSAIAASPARTGAAVAAALACALVAVAAGRRRGLRLREGAPWVGAALALGPIGLALPHALAALPARVRCACGGQRRLDLDRHAACGAGLPAPEADGTEVFD